MIEVGPGHGLTRIAGELAGPPTIALEAGGNSVKGLLLAVGIAFVLGAPVRIGALFDGRFVRPFDLDRARRFLANPCELAPSLVAPQERKPVERVRSVPSRVPGAGQTPLEDNRKGLLELRNIAAARMTPTAVAAAARRVAAWKPRGNG